MKGRLIQASLIAILAGGVGIGVATYMRSTQTFGIVASAAVAGFLFGLVFKVRPV